MQTVLVAAFKIKLVLSPAWYSYITDTASSRVKNIHSISVVVS